jgi:hypothetical protein
MVVMFVVVEVWLVRMLSIPFVGLTARKDHC